MTISIAASDIQALKDRYEQAGQGQVFRFFDDLSNDEQRDLFQQLTDIHVERVNEIYQLAVTSAAAANATSQEASVEPLSEDVFDSVIKASAKTRAEWETVGLRQIAEGKVAVILMAGGQGTRLGSSAPKGCYDIHLPSGKTLFQLQAERILRLQDLARQYRKPSSNANAGIIPWYIMTSGPTHDATYSFFKSNRFFGLNEENVIFFQQGTLPCLTFDGKIMLENKHKVAMAPDGNGGIYSAIQTRGVIQSLKERGIEYSHCYCVDNCLARVADPVFIGYCVSKGTDCGVKVAAKAAPEEPVGVVCVRDGRYGVVEYSEISKEVSEKRREDGSLAFGAANIANHFFSTAFLERVPSFSSQLAYHIAKKKIKHVDLETGELVVPKTNSGMKLECFVFDVFPFAEQFSVLEIDRKDEFSPLKNGPGAGVDCPETSRRDIIAQHVRFIEAAGGRVEGDPEQFEMSPWVTYGGEGLREIVEGKTIRAPVMIETRQDLIHAAKANPSSSSKDNSYVFEQQNDVRMDELGSKLSALKNITIDMHNDVNNQDSVLEDSHQAFGGLGNSMRQSYGRMNRMISTRHKRQMCFYVAVAVSLFFVFYWASGWIGSSDEKEVHDAI